jgi:hypothetical protein
VALIAAVPFFRIGPAMKTLGSAYPVKAAEFLQQRGWEKGRLFNSYTWGGYLLWKGVRVFIDGRADVYTPLIDDFARAYYAKPGWENVLDRFEIQTVLIEPGSPLAGQLERRSGWEKAYADGVAVIFRRQETPAAAAG